MNEISYEPDTIDSLDIGDCFESEAGTTYRVVGLETGRARVRYLLERVDEPAL